jgi:hypothetical protein
MVTISTRALSSRLVVWGCGTQSMSSILPSLFYLHKHFVHDTHLAAVRGKTRQEKVAPLQALPVIGLLDVAVKHLQSHDLLVPVRPFLGRRQPASTLRKVVLPRFQGAWGFQNFRV